MPEEDAGGSGQTMSDLSGMTDYPPVWLFYVAEIPSLSNLDHIQ